MSKKKPLSLVFVVIVCTALLNHFGFLDSSDTIGKQNHDLLSQAFSSRQSDLQVQSEGTVTKVLPDDTKGSRHQRFILRTSPNQTVLVAHNIDLAPRVNNLRVGDLVEFYGEYEWNRQGGVIHWTHHDPNSRHPGGWLKHKGRTYE